MSDTMQSIPDGLKAHLGHVLVENHNGWVRYRDQQPPHPPKGGGVNIARALAESRISKSRKLIEILVPDRLVPATPEEQERFNKKGLKKRKTTDTALRCCPFCRGIPQIIRDIRRGEIFGRICCTVCFGSTGTFVISRGGVESPKLLLELRRRWNQRCEGDVPLLEE